MVGAFCHAGNGALDTTVVVPTTMVELDESHTAFGEATREGDRSVRVPLVLGDADGGTSPVVLTIQLDALVEEDPG